MEYTIKTLVVTSKQVGEEVDLRVYLTIVKNMMNMEAFIDQENNQSQVTQLDQQLTQQNQPSLTTINHRSWYTGSPFARMLVVILFIVWVLYKMGCLRHD